MSDETNAHWRLIIGELFCKDCSHFRGDVAAMPCDDYPNIALDEEGSCPAWTEWGLHTT